MKKLTKKMLKELKEKLCPDTECKYWEGECAYDSNKCKYEERK